MSTSIISGQKKPLKKRSNQHTVDSLITTHPTAEPLHLTEVKNHLKVDFTDDDTLISSYISAAREWAETFTNRQLVLAEREAYLPYFQKNKIELPFSPLIAVDSIKYDDEDDAEQTFSSSSYTTNTSSQPGSVTLNDNSTWPDTYENEVNEVRIKYWAGELRPFTANAATSVLTCQDHQLSNGDSVLISNSGGALPAPLAAKTKYFVVNVSGDTLQLSATSGGAAISLTTAGAGLNFIGELPPAFRTAIMLKITKLYENRGDMAKTKTETSEMMLWPYRIITY